jgi:hypothetical protein
VILRAPTHYATIHQWYIVLYQPALVYSAGAVMGQYRSQT